MGLIIDESCRTLGLVVGTTVPIAPTWGLRSSEVRGVVMKKNVKYPKEIQTRQISVNLIELRKKSEIEEGSTKKYAS